MRLVDSKVSSPPFFSPTTMCSLFKSLINSNITVFYIQVLLEDIQSSLSGVNNDLVQKLKEQIDELQAVFMTIEVCFLI